MDFISSICPLTNTKAQVDVIWRSNNGPKEEKSSLVICFLNT